MRRKRGHKRLILVFGEHPTYSPEFIADTVRTVYSVREGRGEIRRVNINAASLDHQGYKTVKAAGIGTYQVFQETYHYETYAAVHPRGTLKSDYLWRLDALDRAYEGGVATTWASAASAPGRFFDPAGKSEPGDTGGGRTGSPIHIDAGSDVWMTWDPPLSI